MFTTRCALIRFQRFRRSKRAWNLEGQRSKSGAKPKSVGVPMDLRERAGGVVNRFLHPSSSSQSFYGSGGHPGSTRPDENVQSLLQSICTTLCDVQSQLSTIKQQNDDRDVSLKKLVTEIEDLKKRKSEVQPPQAKRSRRTPRGLSACVRRVHSALDEDAQYDGTQRVGSEHNRVVTQRIVKDVITSGDYTNQRDVEYAAKKHHEYLVRLEKDELPEAKAARLKAARIKQRRIRLYERRCMQARGKEVEVMQQLNEKAMTDEETDCDDTDSNVLVKRTPPWRVNKLTKLIKTLDSRKDSKADTVPKKDRKTGRPSERSPPKDLPKWALRDASTSEPYSSSLSDSSSPLPTPGSPMQCPTQTQWLTPPSGPSSSQGLTPPSSRSSNQGLTPPSSRSSNQGLTPPSRQSAPHALFYSPPMETLPSTLRIPVRESPICTPLSPNDSIPSESNEDLSEGDYDDDETSVWIRAVTGIK